MGTESSGGSRTTWLARPRTSWRTGERERGAAAGIATGGKVYDAGKAVPGTPDLAYLPAGEPEVDAGARRMENPGVVVIIARRRLPPAIDICSVTNEYDVDPSVPLIDAVHDAEISSMGAMQTLELETERAAGASRLISQHSVDELDGRSGNLLGQTSKRTFRRPRPFDRVGPFRHRSGGGDDPECFLFG